MIDPRRPLIWVAGGLWTSIVPLISLIPDAISSILARFPTPSRRSRGRL